MDAGGGTFNDEVGGGGGVSLRVLGATLVQAFVGERHVANHQRYHARVLLTRRLRLAPREGRSNTETRRTAKLDDSPPGCATSRLRPANTIRYDTIRDAILTCARKPT